MVEAKDIIEKAIKEAREEGRGKIISRDDIYSARFKAGQESGCYAEGWANGINVVVEYVDRFELIEEGCRDEWQVEKKVWFNEKV